MVQSTAYVSADYLRKTAEMLSHVKRRTYELMRISPGARVLDVGCGPGVDTIPLARWVGEQGCVVGIDIDEDMLSQANARAHAEGLGGSVIHRHADVAQLPEADGTYDACRAERLFQVLPKTVSPEGVLGEVVRVTRPGGWIVVADADWATASLDLADAGVERRLARFFAEQLRPNGYAGRQLYRWMRRAGLVEVEAEVFPIVHTHSSRTHYGDWLQREALAAGVITPEEAGHWRAAMAHADDAGEFFASGCMIVVSGRRPD